MKKYESIVKDIRIRMETGILSPGDQLMTEQGMSDYYNVSKITIKKALSILREENLITTIQGSGSFISEKSIPQHKKKYISVIIANTVKELIQIVEGADQVLSKYDIFLSMHITNGDAHHEQTLCNEAIANGASGIIIFPINEETNHQYFYDIVTRGYPIVFVDRAVHQCPCNFVATDGFIGMFKLTQHLIDQGHTRFAYISGGNYTVLQHRLNGFKRAITNNHLEENNQYIFELPIEFSSFLTDFSILDRTIQKLLELPSPPTAIIACNDAIAINAIRYLRKMHLRVPEDLAIAGFDNSEQAKNPNYSLTSIAQDFFALGEEAATILYHKIINSSLPINQCYIPPKLIVRNSTSYHRRTTENE